MTTTTSPTLGTAWIFKPAIVCPKSRTLIVTITSRGLTIACAEASEKMLNKGLP
jgi:adenine/guanine phosphoribosyltransferase-like PRPP-binding protein